MSDKPLQHRHQPALRAIDDIRRGFAVCLQGAGQSVMIQAAEATETMEATGESVPPDALLILTKERAGHLKLATKNQPYVSLPMAKLPAADRQKLLAGESVDALPEAMPQAATDSTDSLDAAMWLMREAGWLPATLLWQGTSDAVTTVAPTDVLALSREPITLSEVTPTPVRLPLTDAENASLRMFQETLSGRTHLVVQIGEVTAHDAPLTRIHSSCFTGDLLGSLRCDCGDQLQLALARMTEAGSGLLLYLNQEGRGIGLANKLKAYGLQDRGADTVEANEMLGFKADERDFSVAITLLEALGITQIELLTNNPAKQQALINAGIRVKHTHPLTPGSNTHNEDYLATKRQKLGHQHDSRLP